MDVALASVEQESDGPWPLPKGWCWTTFGTIASLRGEKVNPASEPNLPFVGMDDIEPNGTTVLQTHPFGTMKSAGNRFHKNDVLYGRLRPYLNKTALATTEGACSGELLAITASVAVDPKFIQLFMHTRRFVNAAMGTVSGDRPRIDFTTIATFDFPLPPVAEQRRIVARVDALFAEIAEGEVPLAAARKGLDSFGRAVLKAAVTGELTKDWRETNHVSETGHDLLAQLRDSMAKRKRRKTAWKPGADLLELPKSWAWCAVDEAGDVQLGRQRAPQHHGGAHMRPYLRVANVLEDRLNLSDVKLMNFTPEEFKIFALNDGDILLNEGQAPDLLGRPAMYRGEIEGCCFQKTLLRFRASELVDQNFALLVFRHYMHSGRFKRESRITTNIGHLTQVRFVEMEFPIPPPEEVAEILRRVSETLAAATDTLAMLEAEAADAARLKQSVLNAAFEGRLTQQDPSDEPASALLARLKTQDSIDTSAKRGRAKSRHRKSSS